MNSNAKVCIIETLPHRQFSYIWTGATTVAKVITIVDELTTFSSVKPTDFLRKNNNFDPNSFLDDDGEIDYEKITAWENSLPIEAHFQAAIDCAIKYGYIIKVYWTREEAEEAGAPRHMSFDDYLKQLEFIF